MRAAMVLYLATVALLAVHMTMCRAPAKESSMGWAEEKDQIEVKAKPDGTWTWAYDYVKGPALIKFEATGEWRYSPAKECSADGDLNSMISAKNCILPDAPVGALIVKIGGSTAGAKDGKLFLAGREGLVEIDQGTSGPIFLTINDELTGMSDNDGVIKVKISLKPISQAAPPPAPAPSKPPAPPSLDTAHGGPAAGAQKPAAPENKE
jgi:hypothetical protein